MTTKLIQSKDEHVLRAVLGEWATLTAFERAGGVMYERDGVAFGVLRDTLGGLFAWLNPVEGKLTRARVLRAGVDIKRVLKERGSELTNERVWFYVDARLGACGAQFAKALGFEFEGIARGLLGGGRPDAPRHDAFVYARIF